MWKGTDHTHAQFIADGHGQQNAQTGNPDFVNWSQRGSNNDYHLKSTSPAIDTGIDLSSYFTTDMDGNTRTGSWEIGPYNYSVGGPSIIGKLWIGGNGKIIVGGNGKIINK